jgi:hypothetical protein
MNKKKYFIAEEEEQKGPFSFNELKEMGISKSTLIWKEGFEDWTEAGKIEKLQSLLKITPPKLPKGEGKKKKKDKTLNVNLGLGKPKTNIELKEKELASEKLKTSVAKGTIYFIKRILISITIFIVLMIIYYYVESSMSMYIGNGVLSEDYQEMQNIFNVIYVIMFVICFFIIFGRPLSQIFGWFKKHSEKEI